MVTYHILKEKEQELKLFVNLGICSEHWVRDLNIYNDFLKMKQNPKRKVNDIYIELSMKYYIGTKRLEKIISKLSETPIKK